MLFCADPTFGLNRQALAILHYLAGLPPSFARYDQDLGRYSIFIRTYPWLNGREKGVALVVFRGSGPEGPCRVIAFGEDRGSSGLFVEHWEEPVDPLNGPTVADRDLLMEAKERAGAKTVERVDFNEGRIGEAASHIYDLMEQFYSEKTLKLIGGGR